jgi:ribosomal protein S18 acetylase RimI-like enzyme
MKPFTIREATASDIPALADLHVRTFRETHGGGPTRELRESQYRAKFAATDGRWFCFVAEDPQGDLIGFAVGEPHDDRDRVYEGELNKIYVLREYHRHGAGRALVCSVARRFLTQGIASMLLFGDARNASNGFYERLGAERLVTDKGEFHGGYGWRDLSQLVNRSSG